MIENDGSIQVNDIVNLILNYDNKVNNSYDLNVKYWNNIYKNELETVCKPSNFTLFAASYMQADKKVIDIGCGNGRDSLLFIDNGLRVVGVDSSEVAINRLNNRDCDKISMFVCDDLLPVEHYIRHNMIIFIVDGL